MKKIISLCLTLSMCLSLAVSAKALGVDSISSASKEQEKAHAIDVLVKSGWTKEEIEDLIPEEALLEFADASPAVATSEKYLKVSQDVDGNTVVTEMEKAAFETETNLVVQQREQEELAEIQQQLMGENCYSLLATDKNEVRTKDGYMKYYVQAIPGSKAGRYILSARYEWIVEPSDRLIDVFGLGHDAHLTQNDSESKVYYRYKADVYMIASGNRRKIEDYEVERPTKMFVDSGGTVVSQQLYKNKTGFGYNIKAENHRGYIQYTADKSETTAKRAAVYAEYLHQESTIHVAPGISYPAGGSISVTHEDKFERMSPNPYLAFAV